MIRKPHYIDLLSKLLLSLTLALLLVPQHVLAQTTEADVFEEFTDDFIPGEHRSCAGCAEADTCMPEQSASGSPWLRYGIMLIAAVGASIYLARKFNWKVAALLVTLVALGFIPRKETCTIHSRTPESNLTVEIVETDYKNEFVLSEKHADSDAFEEFEEFEEWKEPEKNNELENTRELEGANSTDEFNELADSEFAPLSEEQLTTERQAPSLWSNRNFNRSITVLLLTIVAGLLVRFKTTRKLKNLMLLGTMIYLGFITGACPCMISSLQNTILYLAGMEVDPMLLLWFLGLIPLTYIFGKVWCGWVCHLGALQEFIFRPGVRQWLENRKSQLILRWMRIATFAVLVAQVLITRTNIFIHYDPFKVAFNLFSANTTGYILLVILLISSLLIYRPFCRAICPVGLILGWVSLLPGSAKLAKNSSCKDCKSCSNACHYQAMTWENKNCQLNQQDCILCGECMDVCHFKSIEINGIVKR